MRSSTRALRKLLVVLALLAVFAPPASAHPTCTDDAYEENDSLGAAYTVTNGQTLTGAVSCIDDPDYYRIAATAGQQIEATLTLDDDVADIYLLDSFGYFIAGSFDFNTTKRIAYTVPDTDSYFILVEQFSDPAAHYDISFALGTCSNVHTGTLTPGVPTLGELCGPSEHHYALSTTALVSEVDVTLNFDHDLGDLDIAAFDGSGSFLGGSFGVSDPEEFSFVSVNPQEVSIDLWGFFGASNSYSLLVEVVDKPCTYTGTEGNDNAVGTPGNDVMCLGGGKDKADGLAGDDIILGGEGNDKIRGGDGYDVIYGGPGNDKLDGGSLDDIIYGEEGNDKLIGGTDPDFWDYDICIGGPGKNKFKGCEETDDFDDFFMGADSRRKPMRTR